MKALTNLTTLNKLGGLVNLATLVTDLKYPICPGTKPSFLDEEIEEEDEEIEEQEGEEQDPIADVTEETDEDVLELPEEDLKMYSDNEETILFSTV